MKEYYFFDFFVERTLAKKVRLKTFHMKVFGATFFQKGSKNTKHKLTKYKSIQYPKRGRTDSDGDRACIRALYFLFGEAGQIYPRFCGRPRR